MATAQRPKPEKDTAQVQRDALSAIIGEQVMHTLGEPVDLVRVQVRELWEGHYRVNILVGPDIASVRVCNSYFVVADPSGNIVTATPPIKKSY